MNAKTLAQLLVPVATLALAGCSKDPVSVSRPVGISLPVASKDAGAGGAIAVDKNINTENGNPYGAFVNDAVNSLGGRHPSRISVVALSLELLQSSTNVTALEQVFTGPVALSFQMSGSNTIYPVGTATSPTGTLAGASASFDSQALPPADYDALLGGQFKVLLTGTAPSGFATANATADLVAHFVFEAYE
jgi:hypothetical protein